MTDMKMIQDIVTAYGPSGREDIVTEVLKSYVEPLVDEVYTDTLGNLIAHKKGTSGKKGHYARIQGACDGRDCGVSLKQRE